MKKIFIVLSLFLIVFGCGEKESKIELIENNDLIYLTIAELKSKPVLRNDIDEIKKEIKSAFLQNINNPESQQFPISLSYDYFVGNNRRIEKLMPTTIINSKREVIRRNGSNLPVNFSENIEPDIIKILEKVEFTSDSSLTKFKGNLFIRLSKEFQDIITTVSFGLETINLFSTDMSGSNLGNIFFVAVENPPSPIGGVEAIQKNIIYPEIAKRAGIQGRVFVRAYIDENGSVVRAEILKGVDSTLDSVAVNAVMKTKFTPGKQKGNPVKTQVSIPIVFKLTDKLENDHDESGTIKGTVHDKNNLPIPAANVFLEGTKIGGATDWEGGFILKKIPPMNYNVKISHLEFKSKTIMIRTSGGKTTTLNITLEK